MVIVKARARRCWIRNSFAEVVKICIKKNQIRQSMKIDLLYISSLQLYLNLVIKVQTYLKLCLNEVLCTPICSKSQYRNSRIFYEDGVGRWLRRDFGQISISSLVAVSSTLLVLLSSVVIIHIKCSSGSFLVEADYFGQCIFFSWFLHRRWELWNAKLNYFLVITNVVGNSMFYSSCVNFSFTDCL